MRPQVRFWSILLARCDRLDLAAAGHMALQSRV